MPRALALAAALLLLLALLAFWPPYLSRLATASRYAHVHAALGTAWLLLLVLQPVLLLVGRRPWHRALGRAGAALGAAFVVSSVLLAHHGLVRMPDEAFAREGRFVYLPLAMALLFATALGLALRWRRVPAAHGRFMACTLLPLLDPVTARLLYFHAPPLPVPWLYQVPAFTLFGIALIALWHRWPAGSPGRGAMGALALLSAVVLAGFFVVPDTEGWQALAVRLRAWPLT